MDRQDSLLSCHVVRPHRSLSDTHLTQVNEPLNRLLQEVFQFLPRLLSGVLLLGLAWLIATILRATITRLLSAARIEERLRTQADLEEENGPSLVTSIGDTVYWLVFLLFLPPYLVPWH